LSVKWVKGGGLVQMVKRMPSKDKALSSSPEMAATEATKAEEAVARLKVPHHLSVSQKM
jgi:hypothetical protein